MAIASGGTETRMKRVAKIEKSLPPPITAAYRALVRSLWAHGQLDPALREMLRLRSAVLANCVY